MGCRQKNCFSGRKELILLSSSNLRLRVGLVKGCSLISGALFLILFDLLILSLAKTGVCILDTLIYSNSSLLISPSSGLESEPD